MIIRTIASVVLCVIMTAHSDAGQPFTSSSTGYDWKSASDSYRHSYCNMLASKLKHLKPDITGDFLYDSLSAFYTSDDPNILKQKITEIVGLTVGASSGSD